MLFSLNSSTYGKLAAQLGTLVVQDLVAASGDRPDDAAAAARPSRRSIGIDEFSALGADNVIALLARGRESGISVLLATQELADLDRAARGLARPGARRHRASRSSTARTCPRRRGRSPQMVGHREGVGADVPDRPRAARRLQHAAAGRAGRSSEFIVHPNEIKTLADRRGGRDHEDPRATAADRTGVEPPRQRSAPGRGDRRRALAR